MTCPGNGKWFQDENNKEVQIKNETSKYFTMEYTKKGSYYCEYDSTNYYFHVQGKGEFKKKSQFLNICCPCQLSSSTSRSPACSAAVL